MIPYQPLIFFIYQQAFTYLASCNGLKFELQNLCCQSDLFRPAKETYHSLLISKPQWLINDITKI